MFINGNKNRHIVIFMYEGKIKAALAKYSPPLSGSQVNQAAAEIFALFEKEQPEVKEIKKKTPERSELPEQPKKKERRTQRRLTLSPFHPKEDT